MDPLSAVASAIALFQAAKGISKGVQFLRSLRGVPAEFSDLLDELSTLQSVVDHVEAASAELPSLAPPFLSRVDCGIIVSLKDDLVLITDELNSMCSRLAKPQRRPAHEAVPDGSQTERVSLFRWQAEKGNITKIRNKARNTREHLTLCFAVFSSSQL